MTNCKHGYTSDACELCKIDKPLNQILAMDKNLFGSKNLSRDELELLNNTKRKFTNDELEALKKENQELRDKITILETQMSQIGAASVIAPRDHLTAAEFKEMFYNKPSGGLNFIEYRPDQEEYFLNFENAHSPVIVPHDTMLSPLMDRASYQLRKKIKREESDDEGSWIGAAFTIAFIILTFYGCVWRHP
jgi:hypothetical protein